MTKPKSQATIEREQQRPYGRNVRVLFVIKIESNSNVDEMCASTFSSSEARIVGRCLFWCWRRFDQRVHDGTRHPSSPRRCDGSAVNAVILQPPYRFDGSLDDATIITPHQLSQAKDIVSKYASRVLSNYTSLNSDKVMTTMDLSYLICVRSTVQLYLA